MPRITIAEIDRELVLRNEPGSLHRFATISFAQLETVPFVDNWHLEIACDYLERVSRCEIMRLIINEPPGCMKSLLVSVMWPLWEWIFRPSTKWMFASYSPTLAARDGRRCMQMLHSKWWQRRFEPRLTQLRPAATNFKNTGGGFRFATSVGGAATGEHADIQVFDDPTKPQALSEWSDVITGKALESVATWWKQTMGTRKANPATFRRVGVAQRIHEKDLPGVCLAEGGWTHLCLPMRYVPYSIDPCPCRDPECTPEDPRTEPGELLWPERFPEEVVKEDEARTLGPSVASAQYQQRPTPVGGGIFDKSWFRYWHTKAGVPVPQDNEFPCRDEFCVVLPEGGLQIESWDMTFKSTAKSDFVAGGVWLWDPPNAYLIHQVCDRMTFIQTCKALTEVSRRYPRAFTKLVEEKANGAAVIDILKKHISGLIPINPKASKSSRMHAVSGLFEAGNVFIPHPDLAPWVPSYRVQVSQAPKGTNDDMVDQTTQALLRLARKGGKFVDAMRVVRKELES